MFSRAGASESAPRSRKKEVGILRSQDAVVVGEKDGSVSWTQPRILKWKGGYNLCSGTRWCISASIAAHLSRDSTVGGLTDIHTSVLALKLRFRGGENLP